MSGTSLDGIDLAQIVFYCAWQAMEIWDTDSKLFHINPLVKQIKTALTLSNEDLAQLNQTILFI
jgi:hypothetical protein